MVLIGWNFLSLRSDSDSAHHERTIMIHFLHLPQTRQGSILHREAAVIFLLTYIHQVSEIFYNLNSYNVTDLLGSASSIIHQQCCAASNQQMQLLSSAAETGPLIALLC